VLETIRNAWKIADLRKKILYTLFMLLVYRVLCFIPTPGVNLANVQAAMQNSSFLEYMSTMTGSQLSQFTIMAMGITPYINASIIMQLLAVVFPKLEALQKEGEEGRKKIAQITRYVTVGLGFVQAVALAIGLGAASGAWYNYVTVGICLAAGTALAMWIGEQINDKGIGNGISLLIFAGIVANLSSQIFIHFRSFSLGGVNIWQTLTVLVVSLVMIVGVVLVDMGERRIPVQYAKRMQGRKMYGGQSTHIPLKVNSSGVLPLIFASALMQFPAMIIGALPETNKVHIWWNGFYGTSAGYIIVFALLILGFTFFYNSISFNPIEISKNLQQNGGMIPGIRQGKPTSDFIAKISSRITLFGALFLALLATLPTIFWGLVGVSLPLVASSLLIAVSVAIETMRQLESQMTMRHYKGFLK